MPIHQVHPSPPLLNAVLRSTITDSEVQKDEDAGQEDDAKPVGGQSDANEEDGFDEGDEETGDGPKIGGDIMDISNSYAIKHLEKLVTTGQLTETRCMNHNHLVLCLTCHCRQGGATQKQVREAVSDGAQNL